MPRFKFGRFKFGTVKRAASRRFEEIKNQDHFERLQSAFSEVDEAAGILDANLSYDLFHLEAEAGERHAAFLA